jgi:hypothetical protein
MCFAAAKEGSLSLEELDLYRFIEAPSHFSKKTGAQYLELGDLQKLMDWKMYVGYFAVFVSLITDVVAAVMEHFAHPFPV